MPKYEVSTCILMVKRAIIQARTPRPHAKKKRMSKYTSHVGIRSLTSYISIIEHFGKKHAGWFERALHFLMTCQTPKKIRIPPPIMIGFTCSLVNRMANNTVTMGSAKRNELVIAAFTCFKT